MSELIAEACPKDLTSLHRCVSILRPIALWDDTTRMRESGIISGLRMVMLVRALVVVNSDHDKCDHLQKGNANRWGGK